MKADFFHTLFVYISLTCIDQIQSPGIELLEVVGGKADVTIPLKAQPLDVSLDGLDVLSILRCGVGIVKTKIALSAVLSGETEV